MMKKGMLLTAVVALFAAAVGCDNQKSTTPSAFHPPPSGVSGVGADGPGAKKTKPPAEGQNAAPIQP